MIKPEVLDAMVAAGCTAQQIAAAVKADQSGSSGAARQARYRAKKASQSDERNVTTVTVTGEVSPKEIPPTPPKEITPSQSETNVSSKTPRAALETVLDAARAGDVIEMRQRIRKPLTRRAAELLAGQLAQWHDPNEAADAMVLNAWQGFKPEYLKNQRARGSPAYSRPERPDHFANFTQELIDGQDRDDRSDGSNRDDAQGVPVLTIDYHRG